MIDDGRLTFAGRVVELRESAFLRKRHRHHGDRFWRRSALFSGTRPPPFDLTILTPIRCPGDHHRRIGHGYGRQNALGGRRRYRPVRGIWGGAFNTQKGITLFGYVLHYMHVQHISKKCYTLACRFRPRR